MEIISGDIEEAGLFLSGWLWIRGIPMNAVAKLVGIAQQARKIAADDPRKLIHSLKVGLALTLVSLFYYFQPLYSSFGVSAMWAVMTVVVVFEFSVGATLGKGLNRGLATLAAGALGLAAHHLATVTGKTCEPILIGLFVFLQAVASTFIRFFPRVKARYDYGMLIFILTFCLVSISGLRTDEILDLAQKRFSTIVIGASTCLTVSIFVYPVWAGEDLHKLVAKNIEKLGNFLEGFGREYFETTNEKSHETRASMVGYKAILNSKATEESLVNFAKWEPRHGKFRYWHPWDQYLKIGTLTRECACRIDALNACLNSEMQAPLEIRRKMKEACTEMSWECSNALRELAVGIKTMARSSPADPHMRKAESAANDLKSLLQTPMWSGSHLLDVCPVATVASLLIEIVSCTAKIADSVHELASLSKFKKPNAITPDQKENVTIIPVDNVNEGSVMIVVPLDNIESIDRSHQSSNE
ncbi:aluminum activated malate transporter family protein [Perilla frutescens var. frutescens]|nr:aluminum activated malate transporter family protein [Perilla frutescens var. frutescens]